MLHHSKRILFAWLIACIPFAAFAQTSDSTSTSPDRPNHTASDDENLNTPTGSEVNFGMGHYTYVEPGTAKISIHGQKFSGGYTGTFSLNENQHWFVQAGVQGFMGHTTYDGWCSPYLITPESTSPNGYALDFGDSTPCSENGDKDWYLKTRGLVGKDFIGRKWGWSPTTGVGVRYLSNGTTDVAGYRTDNYLYIPIGLSARTRIESLRLLSLNVEYDRLIRGWQTTRDSNLGGGDFPATPTAPAFTLDGFSNISFEQHSGYALRASAKYHVSRHWSVEPAFIQWHVNASPVNYETATFTVRQITVQQQLGAYEPLNRTSEFVMKLGFHF